MMTGANKILNTRRGKHESTDIPNRVFEIIFMVRKHRKFTFFPNRKRSLIK